MALGCSLAPGWGPDAPCFRLWGTWDWPHPLQEAQGSSQMPEVTVPLLGSLKGDKWRVNHLPVLRTLHPPAAWDLHDLLLSPAWCLPVFAWLSPIGPLEISSDVSSWPPRTPGPCLPTHSPGTHYTSAELTTEANLRLCTWLWTFHLPS